MSDGAKRHSYRIVGGREDGFIYDDIGEEETNDLRDEKGADFLELVPDVSGSSGGVLDGPEQAPESGPIDQPRVSPVDIGTPKIKSPRGNMVVGDIETIKSPPMFDVDAGDVGVEPTFAEPGRVERDLLDELDAEPPSFAGLDIGDAAIEPEMNVVNVGEEDPNELLEYEADTARIANAQAHTNSPAWTTVGQPGEFRLPMDWLDVSPPADAQYTPEDQWLGRPDPTTFDAGIQRELGGAIDLPSSGAGVDRAIVEPMSRAFNKSLLLGTSDEAAGGLASLAGNDLADSVELERAQNEYQANTHPVPWALGRVGGYLPGLYYQPASILGRGLLNTGAAIVEGAGSSDSNDWDQTWSDALWNGVYGVGTSLLGETLGALAPRLRGAGVAQRRASAAPGNYKQLNDVRQAEGMHYMERGLDQAFDDLGLASKPWLQSAADVNARIGPQQGPGMWKAAGDAMGDAVDEAGAAGVRGDWDRVQANVAQRAAAKTANVPVPTDEALAEVSALQSLGDRLPHSSYQMASPTAGGTIQVTQQPAPPALPRELQNQKVEHQKRGKFKKGVQAAPPDEVKASAHRDVAGSLADELNETMWRGPPETYNKFTKNRDAYQDLAMFEQMSGDQAVRVQDRSQRNPATYVASAAAPAAGAWASNALGLGPGPGAAAGAATGILTSGIGQKYGQDALGLGMMGTSKLMKGAAKASPLISRMGPKGSRDEPNVTESAMNLIGSDQTAFGHYLPRFLDAMAAGELPAQKAAVSALMTELIQTDPEFRQYVLPLLRTDAVKQR